MKDFDSHIDKIENITHQLSELAHQPSKSILRRAFAQPQKTIQGSAPYEKKTPYRSSVQKPRRDFLQRFRRKI